MTNSHINTPSLEKLAILSCSRIHESVQENLLALLDSHALRQGSLLDVGCWDGQTTRRYADKIAANRVLGVEGFENQAKIALANGIDVQTCDIEKTPLAIPTASIDTVVCNQVFEHLKDIFHPMDEIIRVLKPGGIFLLSVPNLASLHNRILLLLGKQPTSIRVFGPHVRSFTLKELILFATAGGMLQLVEVRGVGFYPFSPAFLGNFFSNLWKYACHTPILVLRRTSVNNYSFSQTYANQGEQTLI